jgi:murein DD-endopeptidase MepM/ murein hydrolase activator NlpD
VDDCVVSIQSRVKIAGSELICSGVAQAKPVNTSNCSEEANPRRYPERMRWLIVLMAVTLGAQVSEIAPAHIHNGETLKLTARGQARKARLAGRTVELFPQEDGSSFGLMPVPVLEKPGVYNIEFLSDSGVVLESRPIRIENAHYPSQNIVIAKAIAALKPSPGEQQTVSAFRTTVSPVRYWKEPLHPPVPGCLTSLFGVQRLHNGKPTGDFHAGVDQRGAAGTPIHPIAAGVVKIVEKWNLRGGTVAVDHGQGVESIYLHMSGFVAKDGEHVGIHDVLGYIGSTGRSTGPHVHWTLYVNGVPVNPGQWMALQACPVASKRPRAK